MMLALKVAYDGKMFTGSARQPGLRTVEGTIIEGLTKLGAIDEEGLASFKAASRTDRGVSALGNVFVMKARMKGGDIVGAMNGTRAQEGLWFLGWAQVPDDFRPRHALHRWYRYVLPMPGCRDSDLEAMKKAASMFIGQHDFGQFCKTDKSLDEARSTVRTLEDIKLDRISLTMSGHNQGKGKRLDLMVVDLWGQSFLWQMVRRVVSAIVGVAKGKFEPEEIRNALLGNIDKRKDYGVLPSEGLTLMDISYDIEFHPAKDMERLREDLETEVLWDLAKDLVFHHQLQDRLVR